MCGPDRSVPTQTHLSYFYWLDMAIKKKNQEYVWMTKLYGLEKMSIFAGLSTYI